MQKDLSKTKSISKLEILKLHKKVILRIPENVLDEIQYLCSVINDVEWSGVLFYEVIKESSEYDELILKALGILPMNKGTAAYTEYTFDETVVGYMLDNGYDLTKTKMGLVHSHNHMNVFFSSTDMDELNDNSYNYNIYLSLIVNNKGDMSAKLAQQIKNIKLQGEVLDENGNKTSIISQSAEPKLGIYDVEIHIPRNVNLKKDFLNQVDNIIKKADSLKKIQYNPLSNTKTLSYENNSKKISNKEFGLEITNPDEPTEEDVISFLQDLLEVPTKYNSIESIFEFFTNDEEFLNAVSFANTFFEDALECIGDDIVFNNKLLKKTYDMLREIRNSNIFCLLYDKIDIFINQCLKLNM